MSSFVTLGSLGAVTLVNPFAPSVPTVASPGQMTVTQAVPTAEAGFNWSGLLSLGTTAIQATAPLWQQYLPGAVTTLPAVQQILTPQPVIVQVPAAPAPVYAAAPGPSVMTYLPWALGALALALLFGGRR